MFWWILAVSLCVAFIYHRASLKERLLVNSRIKRMLRWEYWPSYILYLPVALYSLRLACKHKCLTAFYVANPGLYHGGMYGEKKSLALQQIGEQFPDAIAETLLIPTDLPYKRVEHSLRTLHEKNWHYPVVLKPDHGFRGKQVMIIRNDSQLAEYLNRFSAPCLMQPYIEGLEFGIFYFFCC